MASTDRIKVLVVGDSGVGKTSLVHLMAHHEPLTNTCWTIGCNIEVCTHLQQASSHESRCFIELWDIGGNRGHFTSRQMYYTAFHGLILVHDVTNRKSHENLKKWLSEVFCQKDLSKESPGFSFASLMGAPPAYDNVDFDPELIAGKEIPVLVVATKIDLIPNVRRDTPSTISSIATQVGAEEVALNCTCDKSFSPGSLNRRKLTSFFDRVYNRKYNTYTRGSSLLGAVAGGSGTTGTRRVTSPLWSSSSTRSYHLD